jgi:hypothetical protein
MLQVKAQIAKKHPYGQWLKDRQVPLVVITDQYTSMRNAASFYRYIPA